MERRESLELSGEGNKVALTHSLYSGVYSSSGERQQKEERGEMNISKKGGIFKPRMPTTQ